MRTNGIEIRCDADYDKLPFDRETRAMIRAVHRNAGVPAFEMRYNPDGPTRYERRSGRTRIATIATKQFDVARDRLRLRVELLRRVR